MSHDKIRKTVREGYAKIARKSGSCCAPSSCCTEAVEEKLSKKIGYTNRDLKVVPEGADLGLGCGNPIAYASLVEGETVLDLGSGAGLDCFIAANKVGRNGRVIGIDMTPEMIKKARINARRGNYANVEFRQGIIEDMPMDDSTIDVIISNCVINLSPDKHKVFSEAFRVLRPGGRMLVSDIVLLKELPEAVRKSIPAYIQCVAGAMLKEDYLRAINDAGFEDVKVVDEQSFTLDIIEHDETFNAIKKSIQADDELLETTAKSIASVKVYGKKPAVSE